MSKKPDTPHPQIYVYEDKSDPGSLKVGYTARENAEVRVREQFGPRLQKDPHCYILHHVEDAIRDNGEPFTDKQVHKVLEKKGVLGKGEYFYTDLATVKSAILEIKKGLENIENRTETFPMRNEQQTAVNLTENYFNKNFKAFPNEKPQFLWNAKMRFGKTFAAYQLALKMGFTKILVATYKPAVEASWRDDLLSHLDFLNWQFVSRNQGNLDTLDKSKPYVYFASFQDLLGVTNDGEIKKHNEWIHKEEWDMVIQDEYHYGAWRDSAKELLDADDISESSEENKDNVKELIKGKCYLYLSGTPFRAITTGEFTEEQIFNWTYADEQKAKKTYSGPEESNPYASLPEMTILTYQLPEDIKTVALRGENDEFSLSHFFKAEGHYETARFKNEEQVQSWLNILRGKISNNEQDIERDLKLEKEKAIFPFTDKNLYKSLNHMIWFLPDVASCCAMETILKEQHNKFYHDYEIVVAAGKRTGAGIKALEPLNEAMGNPLETKTLTLTCGKLTTGVTVKPWSGIFMLRTLQTPESYFQSAFRVQSPWTIPGEDGKTIIQKEKCYVFDFDPNRALKQIATYAQKLDTSSERSIEDKVSEFIKYLPVLAYDGFLMEEVTPEGLLDMSIGETTSTLLARGWNNNMLLNTSNEVLIKMVNNPEAMRIINAIESYRKKGNVDKSIARSSSVIKELRTKKAEKKIAPEERKQLTKEEREFRGKRELLQEKLKTLVTRLPLFMYLTEHREEKLTDVITKIQSELFNKVTGVAVEDFELLLNLGLFNSELMNQAVNRFRKYESSSLDYTGIKKSELITSFGGFDKVGEPRLPSNERISVPKPLKYQDAKVVFRNNKLIVVSGSKIFLNLNDYYILEEDKVVGSLSEAAMFISGGVTNDWSFFKDI
jgi:hypothetical protein